MNITTIYTRIQMFYLLASLITSIVVWNFLTFVGLFMIAVYVHMIYIVSKFTWEGIRDMYAGYTKLKLTKTEKSSTLESTTNSCGACDGRSQIESNN